LRHQLPLPGVGPRIVGDHDNIVGLLCRGDRRVDRLLARVAAGVDPIGLHALGAQVQSAHGRGGEGRGLRGVVAEGARAVGAVFGFVLVSTTGASTTLIPSAPSCAPVTRYISRARDGVKLAPSAMLPGETATGLPSRTTFPPSWSVLMSSGTCAPLRMAARCSPFDSPAT
jgi:hypothetical protein